MFVCSICDRKMISGINFKNLTLPKINFGSSDNKEEPNKFGLKSNLAPLKEDTLTFSGRLEQKMTTDENPKNLVLTHGAARQVIEEARDSHNMLRNQMNNVLGALVEKEGDHTKKDRTERPIKKIKCTMKAPYSLMEKVSQKKIAKKDKIKDNITDIVRARVVLNTESEEGGDKVIDKITEAVQSGKMKIVEIENYHQKRGKKVYQYASNSALDKLENAILEKSTEKVENLRSDINTAGDSGYIALHLLAELKDGFRGEIQIIGKDVERLKELEDLTYKAVAGKNLDSKYQQLDDLFYKMREARYKTKEQNQEARKLKNAFHKYTREAYLYEKTKPASQKNESFLHLSTLAPSALSDEFDLNNLAKMRDQADKKN